MRDWLKDIFGGKVPDIEEDVTTEEEKEQGLHFYKINTLANWLLHAYDQNGDGVECKQCGSQDIIWTFGQYKCRSCGAEISRDEFMDMICADPPSIDCYWCNTNYPICKKKCTKVKIDPDDPIL